ncbi:MAG: nicotinate-nucleotide--dimethylbenzimidazole phosphoribosyltransferase [Breznakibacter sp.]|nr:nicotinate-nucleotide--dimethylbenzimidazole phosphoribosyltransferase [Breznakibacter sp.]
MKTFAIKPVNRSLTDRLQHKIDFKTKPLGSLGRLEDLALKIGLIQETISPQLTNPHMVIFAGDHGVAEEGVSAFPQEVTFQMVYNFLQGGAAITVLCEQNGIAFKVVDAGVKHEFESHPNLIKMKVANGTQNFANGAAMSLEELDISLSNGAKVVDEIFAQGCNIIGFGEMGIANTTSASALMHVFTGIPIANCVGKGTGINSEGLRIKEEVLERAMQSNSQAKSAHQKLAAFGGFEIAQMVGGMLRAAELKMVVMVDGFIATSAFLAATQIDGNIYDYAIFTHQSEENGHKMMLAYLNAQPLLSLNMRLGEGSGCAVAYPIIKSAVTFLNKMASFEAAGVTNAEDIAANV